MSQASMGCSPPMGSSGRPQSSQSSTSFSPRLSCGWRRGRSPETSLSLRSKSARWRWRRFCRTPLTSGSRSTRSDRTLSLVPDHAGGHMWLGVVEIFTKRAAQGIAECEHALELDRNLAHAHALIGNGKIYIGHAEETEAHVVEALRLSPRDTLSHIWMGIAGAAKNRLGSWEQAIAWYRRAIEANRNYPLGYFGLAAALAQLNRLDDKAGLA